MVLCASVFLYVAVGSPIGSDPTATLALAGFQDNADRVETGVFRASGRQIRTIRSSAENEVSELSFFGAFDYQRGSRRLDRTITASSGSHAPQSTYKVVLAPTYSVYWTDQASKQVAVEKPIASKDLSAINQPFFDPRVMAALYYDNLGTPLEDLLAWLRERPGFRHAIKKTDTVYELAWLSDESREVYTLWLDGSRGFTPIKLDIRAEGSKGARVLTEASYREHNGVWVIETFHITNQRIKAFTEIELAFDWETVNAAVAPELFDWPGMGITDGAQVFDFRLGKDKVVVLGFVGDQDTGITLVKSDTRNWWRTGLLVAASVVLLASIVYVMRIKNRTIRGSEPS